MRRYDIRKGDRTTNGGTVVSGDPNDRVLDHEQSYEYDEIWCPACQSMGRIVCIGPRIPTTGPDGRETALSDDLCVCKCEPNPMLLPSQYVSYIDVETKASSSRAASTTPSTPVVLDEDLEHYFELIDAKTGAPIEGMTYKLSSNGQCLVYDATLAGGKTRAFSLKEHPNLALVAWREGDVR